MRVLRYVLCILLIVANLVVKKIDPESGLF